jgi:hypothetical protein
MSVIVPSHANSVTAGGRTPTTTSVIADKDPITSMGFALIDEGARLSAEDVDCITRNGSECIIHASGTVGVQLSTRSFCCPLDDGRNGHLTRRSVDDRECSASGLSRLRSRFEELSNSASQFHKLLQVAGTDLCD